MPVIIELFGLPGAGKTFLKNKIVDQFAKKKLKVLDRHDAVKLCLKRRNDGLLTSLFKRMPYSIWGKIINKNYCLNEFLIFSSENTELISKYYKSISENCISSSIARIIIGAFVNTCVESKLFELYCKDNEIIIVDEGFYHRFYTLYGNLSVDLDRIDIKKYISMIPLVDGVIFIATPAELCFERMVKRKRFPVILRSLNDIQIMNTLQHGFILFEYLAKENENKKNNYFRYDGESSCVSILDFCMSFVK